MHVRAAEESDIPQTMEIERLSFGQTWEIHNFKSALKETFLVCGRAEILGFLIAVGCYRNISATILKLAVHPDHRRKTVASRLLDRAIDIFRSAGIAEICLDVDMDRKPAIALYHKFGFKISKTILPDVEDEDGYHIMKLALTPEK